jgi:hypothetical protein
MFITWKVAGVVAIDNAIISGNLVDVGSRCAVIVLLFLVWITLLQ